jgi:hypothetical protein
MVYGPCQYNKKWFMIERAIYFDDLVEYVRLHKISDFETLGGLDVWEVFVGVTTWVAWAKDPGHISNGDNIYVVAISLRVAEWLRASPQYKEALSDRKWPEKGEGISSSLT